MKTVEEKLAKSLTAESIDLIPYLPYLLQDLWELGSSPKDIQDMINKHINVSEATRVLDLACGKGAVSVHLASKFGCMIKGIDIMPEFIDFAVHKAQEFGVGKLCEFTVGDITESVKTEKDYDIVILGAVGDVLGNAEETITLLKGTVKKGGYIIIDDAYGKDETNTKYLIKEQWLAIFRKTGVILIDEMIIEDDELAGINNEQQELIIKRANELKEKLPEKAHLFDGYIRSQKAECDELENEISGVTLLLQVID
ncbi:MAG: class I SAM-dependent methyltransferase [Acetivibrionales bacterium]|jgi:2-polyprenyl-3-methyl-5-hydroxy-6-metoxy-1,4-benzoquinol methylase